MQNSSKIILGIDPGTVIMGYGIIKVNKGKIQLLEMDILKLGSKRNAYERLELIHNHVQHVIKQFKPTSFAIEAPFFGKNVQSMLKLGRAQGVAIAAAMQSGLEVTEYSPRKIKQSITGNGNADKLQVWKMLCNLVELYEEPRYMDASDALAVAICHHYQTNNLLQVNDKKVKDWADFLRQNPERAR